MVHINDSQCTLDDAGICTECGAFHGNRCLFCHARGYHLVTCSSGLIGPITQDIATENVRQRMKRRRIVAKMMREVSKLSLLLVDLDENIDPKLRQEVLDLANTQHNYLNL